MKFFALAAAAILTAVVSTASAQTKICIDPGHGGTDPGATGNGQQEAANCLDTGLRFRTWLNTDTADSAGGGSWSVFMTRTTDATVSLSGRTTYANNNGVARFLSIHNNAFSSSSANGIETYSVSSTGTSADLRNKVYEEATAIWPLTKRGTKTANFYVIVNTSMPAELHEMAFITNATDASYLGSATQRDNHARSEMHALQRHYGLAKYTPSSAWVGVADNDTAAWSASANWTVSASTGYYGTNSRVRPTAAVSDQATWTLSLPTTATYRVEAWWVAGTNRAASAPYVINHAGGSTTVNANQQANGSKWNSLGNFSFNAGSNTVRLSCWTTAGFYVSGDAIRFTRL